MGKAPLIGTWIRSKGKRYRRIPAYAEPFLPNPVDHMTSNQLPFNWPYAPRHDARGRPQFQNMREVREAMAKANQHGEVVDWE